MVHRIDIAHVCEYKNYHSSLMLGTYSCSISASVVCEAVVRHFNEEAVLSNSQVVYEHLITVLSVHHCTTTHTQSCLIVKGRERERMKERDRKEGERERAREREREREREKERERERGSEREKARERERKKEKEREREGGKEGKEHSTRIAALTANYVVLTSVRPIANHPVSSDVAMILYSNILFGAVASASMAPMPVWVVEGSPSVKVN